jgi:hypothetical protein
MGLLIFGYGGLAALIAAVWLGMHLIVEGIQRRSLIHFLALVAIPVPAWFLGEWSVFVIPAGTNYWDGINPMAFLLVFPLSTAIGYYLVLRLNREPSRRRGPG